MKAYVKCPTAGGACPPPEDPTPAEHVRRQRRECAIVRPWQPQDGPPCSEDGLRHARRPTLCHARPVAGPSWGASSGRRLLRPRRPERLGCAHTSEFIPIYGPRGLRGKEAPALAG